MDIRYLKYFLVIAKHQNITRASEELHIAQPALSVYLSRMEQQLGMPLFDRKNKRLVINECGLAVLEHARQIVESYDGLLEAVALCRERQETCLKIGVSDLGFLQGTLAEFFQRYPQFRSDIRLCYASDEAELLNRPYDVIIAPLPLRTGTCETIPLYRKELLVAVPENHPYYDRPSIAMEELNGQHLCLSGLYSQFGWFVQQTLDKNSVRLKKLEGTVVGAQCDMLLQKRALGIVVPGMLGLFQGKTDGVRLISFSPPVYRETGLVLGSRASSKAMRCFVDYMVQRFRDCAPEE